MRQNRLFYGDNLEVLRRHVADESVSLIYLDPPFKSDASYNVLFAERDGTRAAAQLHAFEDTWTWDDPAATCYQDVVEAGGRLSQALQAFRAFLGTSDMMAYLAMMAPRLTELHRVLKSNGSLYLHCDPTASHYLKILLDAVFGPQQFKNEIIWKRTGAHSAAHRWNDVHDVILFYTKGPEFTWNTVLMEHTAEHKARFRRQDPDGTPWTDDNLTAPGVRGGESGAPWRGYDPTARGVHWKVHSATVAALVGADRAAAMGTLAKLELLDQRGYILWPKKQRADGGGFPRFKRRMSEGIPIQDVITDIPPLNSQAQERLGYPTQKPEALLERILRASTNEGDVILDPFCGCGTTVAVAHRLNRAWTGIDVTQAAIVVIKQRFRDHFSIDLPCEVVGEPTSLPDAAELARTDPYQFQWWALGLLDARPAEQKKGADRGIDGRRYFLDPLTGDAGQVIFSVKAGHLQATHVRDLRGVVEREKAAQGVMISLEAPTKQMRAEAASAGFIETSWGKFPRLQLVTVEELLSGTAKLKMPPARQLGATFKKAPKVAPRKAEQPTLLQEDEVVLLPNRATRMAKGALTRKKRASRRAG